MSEPKSVLANLRHCAQCEIHLTPHEAGVAADALERSEEERAALEKANAILRESCERLQNQLAERNRLRD